MVLDEVWQTAQRVSLHHRRYREPCRRIGPDAPEPDMPETDDAGIADEDVESDHQHHANEHLDDGAAERAGSNELRGYRDGKQHRDQEEGGRYGSVKNGIPHRSSDPLLG